MAARVVKLEDVNFLMSFLKNKPTIQEKFLPNVLHERETLYLCKKVISLISKLLFYRFLSLLLLFPSGKTLGFRFFSLNSWIILKSSRPSASNFSILSSNLMKKISIQVFSLMETATSWRNL